MAFGQRSAKHYEFAQGGGDSLEIVALESSRHGPQGPQVGSLVRAVVLVEGVVESQDGEFVEVVLGRGASVVAHVGDIRAMSSEPARTVFDTSSKAIANLLPLPAFPPEVS